MRIIGGTCAGRILRPSSSLKARPTTDYAKESLFNVLNNSVDFESITVLDLFSGTGNISYEFASRGALSVFSVEIYPPHVKFIKQNSLNFNLHQIHVIQGDAIRFIKSCNEKYDIIFADPPFDMDDVQKLPQTILDKNMLTQGGKLIFEHSKNLNFAANKTLIDARRYGNVHFAIFEQA